MKKKMNENNITNSSKKVLNLIKYLMNTRKSEKNFTKFDEMEECETVRVCARHSLYKYGFCF